MLNNENNEGEDIKVEIKKPTEEEPVKEESEAKAEQPKKAEEAKEVKKEKPKKEKKAKEPSLEEKYAKLAEENAKLKDQLLRKQADFENFRKRTNEERIRDRKYALTDFLSESIEIIDIFDKAVSIEPDDEKLKKYLSGFKMVNSKLQQILQNYGVKKIECLNKPFDPSFHSAMETVEVEGVEPNIVTEVVMEGYTYKDRVLRPAMVKVSK